jgi:hypothetical protein
MTIVGLESVLYGAQDMAQTRRYLEDFGLALESEQAGRLTYRLPDGSSVIVADAADLPPPCFSNGGPSKLVWGVDTAEALAEIEEKLAGQEVWRDSDGTVHAQDPGGVRIAFKVFERRPVPREPGEENAVDAVVRWNRPRRWYRRAEPKTIHHAVFLTPDIDASVACYVRLGFRISDVSRGFGVFLRADGRHDHHNMFLIQGDQVKFHHLSLGVDNIDELMVGANHMQRQGWKSFFGLGRHRISSGIFFFTPFPAGGEFEYFADSDYLDDTWRPMLWEPGFGAFQWAAELPEPTRREPVWIDPVPLPDPIPPFSALSQHGVEHVFLTDSGEAEAAAVSHRKV